MDLRSTLLVVVGTLACVLGSCRESPAQMAFGSFTFEAARRADILTASAGEQTAVIEFCNLSLGEAALTYGCRQKDPALGDSVRGFRVLMMERMRWTSPPFGERPEGVFSPQARPLIASRVDEMLDPSGIPKSPNWYAFSRLKAGGGEDDPIVTTDRQWPLIVCQAGAASRICRIAFLVEGVFVEASWEHHGVVDQAELWRISTGIDTKLRTFIKPSADHLNK